MHVTCILYQCRLLFVKPFFDKFPKPTSEDRRFSVVKHIRLWYNPCRIPENLYSQQNSDEEDLVPPFALNSRQEFYKFYASRKTTGWTTTFIVLCFLSAGISLLLVCFGSYTSIKTSKHLQKRVLACLMKEITGWELSFFPKPSEQNTRRRSQYRHRIPKIPPSAA